jgi:hypothetical protein
MLIRLPAIETLLFCDVVTRLSMPVAGKFVCGEPLLSRRHPMAIGAVGFAMLTVGVDVVVAVVVAVVAGVIATLTGHLSQLAWSQTRTRARVDGSNWTVWNPETVRSPLASSSPYLSVRCTQLPDIISLIVASAPSTSAKMVMVSRMLVRRSTSPGTASRSSNKISASASSTPARMVIVARVLRLLPESDCTVKCMLEMAA